MWVQLHGHCDPAHKFLGIDGMARVHTDNTTSQAERLRGPSGLGNAVDERRIDHVPMNSVAILGQPPAPCTHELWTRGVWVR
jgi:hypothetical protein